MNLNPAENIITLTKAELRAFLAFASEDTSRPYLLGIIVDPSSGRVSATDGHRLLTWTPVESTPIAIPDGKRGTRTDPFTLARWPLEQAAKNARRGENEIVINLGAEGAVARVDVAGVVLPVLVPYADATAPYVESAIPDYAETTPQGLAALNADYLADLALAQKAIGKTGVAIQQPPERLGPALVRFADPQWKAVVMAFHATGLGWDAPTAIVTTTAATAPSAPPPAPAAEAHRLRAVRPPRKVETPAAPPAAVPERLRDLVATLEGFSENQLYSARRALSRVERPHYAGLA